MKKIGVSNSFPLNSLNAGDVKYQSKQVNICILVVANGPAWAVQLQLERNNIRSVTGLFLQKQKVDCRSSILIMKVKQMDFWILTLHYR